MVKRKMRRGTRNTKPASKKGQAVMEYLITYGLALFVILVVLGILFAVVLPMLKTPVACKFTDQTFSCDQKPHSLVAAPDTNEVRMLFQLDNIGSNSVKILDILCTTASSGNVRPEDFKDTLASAPATKLTLGSGQSMTFGIGDEATITEPITCYTESGAKAVLTPNSNFRGALAVKYRYSDEIPGTPDRISVATVTGTVLAGTAG